MADYEDHKASRETVDKDDFLREARKRKKMASEDFSINAEKCEDDLLFLEGGDNQWPDDVRDERLLDGRPCLTINRLPGFVDQVEGDQRQGRAGIKIKPVDSEADPDIAEIFMGLIRNIEANSQADIAYDTAFNAAVSCGFGFFRILTEYVDDDVFEQDILIKRIANQFSVSWDPNAKEYDLSDAEWMFIEDLVSRDYYEAKWPGKAIVEFDSEDKSLQHWATKDQVRIAEYFVKEPVTKTIYFVRDKLKHEYVTDDITKAREIDPSVEILKDREVKSHKIKWYKISGRDILEEADWAGKYIPIIPVWGKELFIRGRRVIRGVIRHAKDPQRLYNYNRSLGAETTALAPKAPYIGTAAHFQGFENQWKEAHKRNFPYLLYNPDPMAPNDKPTRTIPNMSNTAVDREILVASDELKSTTGIYDASLGARSNETSGVALEKRQRQTNTSTYSYMDNMARAKIFTGKQLIDLIPKIFDTARVVRILGEDGAASMAEINTPNDKGQTINDITVGKYDATATVGPSYATQREEAADSQLGFIKVVPEAGPLIGDLVAANMDWPQSDEIAKRMKKMLPPGIAEPEEGEEESPTPGNTSDRGPPPDPMLEIKMQQEHAKLEEIRVDKVKTEAEIEKVDAETKKIEAETAQVGKEKKE